MAVQAQPKVFERTLQGPVTASPSCYAAAGRAHLMRRPLKCRRIPFIHRFRAPTRFRVGSLTNPDFLPVGPAGGATDPARFFQGAS